VPIVFDNASSVVASPYGTATFAISSDGSLFYTISDPTIDGQRRPNMFYQGSIDYSGMTHVYQFWDKWDYYIPLLQKSSSLMAYDVDRGRLNTFATNVRCAAMGNDNICYVLANDGTLWAYNQPSTSATKTQVMFDVRSVSAGGNHVMVLKNDWTLWAKGANNMGQLGDGTSTNRDSLVQVMSDVLSVSAGSDFSLIIKKDGTLWATGNNNCGQLGDGTTTNRLEPVLVQFK